MNAFLHFQVVARLTTGEQIDIQIDKSVSNLCLGKYLPEFLCDVHARIPHEKRPLQFSGLFLFESRTKANGGKEQGFHGVISSSNERKAVDISLALFFLENNR